VDILTPLSRLTSLVLSGAAEPAGGVTQLATGLRQLSDLVALHLWRCRWVTDLAPLTQLTSLQNIDIDGTSVTDLAPLAGLPRLRWLYIGSTDHVLDLSPLRDLPELADLWIADPAPEIDLTPLRGRRTTVHLARKIKLADTARPDSVRIKRF
jgi:hypothetical protein